MGKHCAVDEKAVQVRYGHQVILSIKWNKNFGSVNISLEKTSKPTRSYKFRNAVNPATTENEVPVNQTGDKIMIITKSSKISLGILAMTFKLCSLDGSYCPSYNLAIAVCEKDSSRIVRRIIIPVEVRTQFRKSSQPKELIYNPTAKVNRIKLTCLDNSKLKWKSDSESDVKDINDVNANVDQATDEISFGNINPNVGADESYTKIPQHLDDNASFVEDCINFSSPDLQCYTDLFLCDVCNESSSGTLTLNNNDQPLQEQRSR